MRDMPDITKTPATLLIRLARVHQDPNATIGDLRDAERALDEFCQSEGLRWAYDDNGQPYIVNGLRVEVAPGVEALDASETETVLMPGMRAGRASRKPGTIYVEIPGIDETPRPLFDASPDAIAEREAIQSAITKAFLVASGNSPGALIRAITEEFEALRGRLIKPTYKYTDYARKMSGYKFACLPCGHACEVRAYSVEWKTHVFYCPAEDCGAGYTLVFDAAGDLDGLEPFAG
jgi:hypothetical protein